MEQRPLKIRHNVALFVFNLSILLSQCESACVLPKLRAVSLLARHGDRSPIATYSNDPYKDYPWPGGFSALTPKGEEQMYEAGLIQADRYLRMLFKGAHSDDSCTFDVKKIYVKSSAVQRCVGSAESFLKSFLQECFLLRAADENFIKSLINVTPESEDEMLAPLGKSCPKYEGLLSSQLDLTNPEMKRIIDFESSRGHDILNLIKNGTGLSNFTVQNFMKLDDALFVQKDNGFALPPWTDSLYKDYIHPIARLLYDKIAFSEYLSIRSGALLKDIVDRLQGAIQRTRNETVLYYSAHDISVSAMLEKLDATNQTIFKPGYGAMLALELHDNSMLRDDVEVKIYYSTTYDDFQPLRIDIPRCNSPCAFKEFIEIFRPKLTLDYEKACSVER